MNHYGSDMQDYFPRINEEYTNFCGLRLWSHLLRVGMDGEGYESSVCCTCICLLCLLLLLLLLLPLLFLQYRQTVGVLDRLGCQARAIWHHRTEHGHAWGHRTLHKGTEPNSRSEDWAEEQHEDQMIMQKFTTVTTFFTLPLITLYKYK